MAEVDYQAARWLRDLRRFLPLKSQFVLSGNVRDLQTQKVGDAIMAAPLGAVLATTLREAGYDDVITFDLVSGFGEINGNGVPPERTALDRLGLAGSNDAGATGLDLLAERLAGFVQADGRPVALIVDFASRLLVRSDAPSPAEHDLFTRALVLSQAAKPRPVGPGRSPLFNSVVWIVDKEGDLPDWLTIGNPRVRHVPITTPDRAARREIAPSIVRTLPGAREADPVHQRACEDDLVDSTEGLLLMDLTAIAQLARAEGVHFSRIGDAVRRYKVGVTEDAWKKIERRTVQTGEETVSRRVIGQAHAVTHMFDIVKRAVTGLGGAGRSRPRGVAFLAGPTGVGKTELAKAVTELLFGDETAYIRFDMSEFSAEHADQRLIGAPPGYVGYDVGGELTNAIREKPFSVVLFDEIEKAHPRILDKFLQILDDGVLTSGRGDRVYFSEAFIVFTTNLGIYTEGPAGERVANVGPENTFEEVRQKVRAAIADYFKRVLNRPEILNRFGENIIVFDFIRPATAITIFNGMVDRVLLDAEAAGYPATIDSRARQRLLELCTADLSNGGRGIRNQIEANLINPLARSLFDDSPSGPVRIADIETAGGVTRLLLA